MFNKECSIKSVQLNQQNPVDITTVTVGTIAGIESTTFTN